MRNAFAAELCGLAAHDERIALISSDIGNNLFNEFRERFPSRFMNCGIAEAAMTGIAAGMALCGLKPVTYTIASFNPGRCVEQIRLDICLHNLPVVIVGVGAGLSYASLGPTPHALEDIAWLRAIPGMTILCPADAVETRCALRAALAHDGPVYLRLGKKNEPAVHAGEPDFEIGRNIPLRGGEDACILAVGTVTPIALDAARLLEERSISCAVTGIHTVKPLDTDSLRSVFARYPVVMVMEEHGPVGGTWSAIAEWAAEQNVGTGRLLRCAAPDRFFFEGGGQNWARKRFGIDAEHAALRIADALRAVRP